MDDRLKMPEDEHAWLAERINVGKEILYLSRRDCMENGPGMDETLGIVRRALTSHGRKEYEMPAKIGVHPFSNVFFHAMPAYLPTMNACGCKWIGCYPDNPVKYGLPQTTSLLIFNEILTGCPVCVMDGAWITAMRTPAVTSLAAAKLHTGAKTFGMFGCGVQGVEHVRFVARTLNKLTAIYIYDVRPEAMDNLCESVKNDVAVPVIKAGPEEIAAECEVMSSATVIVREPVAAVKDEWVGRGKTILPCDLNTFWDPKTQLRADKYIVDSAEEHELFAQMGYFPGGLPKIHAQTGEVLAGLAAGRDTDDELVVCSNIGMSVCDVAMARAVFVKALEAGAGVKLEL